MKTLSRLGLTTILFALFFNALAITEAQAQVVNEILKRIDNHQKALFSLRSKVTMEKYNSQLGLSDITEGTTIYARVAKNQIWARIDWTKPVSESFSFINSQYFLYRPRLKQAIVGKLSKSNEDAKIYNALSFLNMSKKEIKANYVISYLGEEAVKDGTKTWHLVFKPKNLSIYKSVDFWVNGDGMPIQAKVFEDNKDSTTVLLSNFKKNEELKAANFQINLPKGTRIIKGSAVGFSCFKPDNANDALNYWSDAVFEGKVVAVNDADYTFKTERVWKGILTSETVVRNFSTNDTSAAKLVNGEHYIVFAQKVNLESKAVLTLMPCNFTSNTVSDNGKKILKEIGKGKPVKKATIKKKRRPLKRSKSH